VPLHRFLVATDGSSGRGDALPVVTIFECDESKMHLVRDGSW